VLVAGVLVRVARLRVDSLVQDRRDG
jgi:hypothetical protein